MSLLTFDERCDFMIDAIVGRGFPFAYEGDHFVKIGLARYTGNQHNVSWEWDRVALRNLGKALGLQELAAIYWRTR